MRARKERVIRTVLDVLLLIAGLVVLAFFLNSVQTTLSIQRQEDNFKTKLDIAQQRMRQNAAEAQDNMTSYDAFSQAKLDSVGSFLDAHPGYTNLGALAQQWGLSEFYLIDNAGRVTFSLGQTIDPAAESFADLLATRTPSRRARFAIMSIPAREAAMS